MKKTIAAVLLGGTILASVAGATNAFAATADHGDGYKTVTGEPNTSVDFVGAIGQFDPETTDPTDPLAPGAGDDAWIKVILPTSVAYYSTGSSKHKDIESGIFRVENKSPYPVAVKLSGFTAGDGASAPATNLIDSLAIHADGTKVFDLISSGGVANKPENNLLFKLGANASNPDFNQDNTGQKSDKSFNLKGQTDGSPSILTGQTEIDNKLHFTLTSLDAEGNETIYE